MANLMYVFSAGLLNAVLCCTVQAQTVPSTQAMPLQVVVASPSMESDAVVAIPPATSWTGTIDFNGPKGASSQAENLSDWVNQQSALNGFKGLSTPWRILIAYEQFDEDGDKIHSGTYEEVWAGPKKYRISYKADDLNETDYATAQGLYRLGDQQWPNRAQSQIPEEVMNPFFYAAMQQGVHVRNVAEKFGDHMLDCTVIENNPGRISSPTQYCFEPGKQGLRYSRGSGWYQTTYNNLSTFSGRSIGRNIDVYDGGKPYLKLRVQQVEAVTSFTDADFTPPVEAKDLRGQVLTGVSPVPVKSVPPEWPDSLRQQHFAVTVEILIGKDGHVQSAHAVSGPQNAFKAAENTARKWVFQPYLVLDEPTEVSTKLMLSNN